MRRWVVMASAILLVGCGKAPPAEQAGAKASATQVSAPTPQAPLSQPLPAPVPSPGVARTVHEANALFTFDYAYPAQAAAIPALKAWLEDDLTQRRRELAASAKDGAKEAKDNAFPYTPYATGVEWKVVTDLPGWLSLSAQIYDDTGGAHPNHAFGALLWDKGAGKRMAAVDLFASPAALSRAIRGPFCDALDRQRAKRRGAPVNRTSGDSFDACIDPAPLPILLGSAGHRGFDRIGVLVAPYVAGPYAEGDYEITLPMTPAVIAAVKPAYRAAFAPTP